MKVDRQDRVAVTGILVGAAGGVVLTLGALAGLRAPTTAAAPEIPVAVPASPTLVVVTPVVTPSPSYVRPAVRLTWHMPGGVLVEEIPTPH